MTGKDGDRSGPDAVPILDIVYPYRLTPDDDEIRYSLRTLVNMPHGTVWIVGDKPPWVQNINHIPHRNEKRSRFRNALENVLAACQVNEISDRFILMNDDFFILTPTGLPPPAHRGPIATAHPNPARRRRTRGRQNGSPWKQGIWDTAALLKRWGVARPLSYELHMPMVVDRAVMADVLTRAIASNASVNLMQRSLYGNVARIGGEQRSDVKIAPSKRDLPDPTFVSTNNRAFYRGWIGQVIKRRFATPSEYE